MWDLPGPGIKPVSLALPDGFLTTGLSLAPIISSNTFCSFLSLFSFWDSHYMYVGTFDIVTHVSEALFIFYYFYFLLLRLYNINWHIFKFLFSACSNSQFSTSVNFSFQLFYFQTPEFEYFILFYFIHLATLLTFFIWWEAVLIFSFNSLCIFKIADFKSLSSKSNI